MRPRRPTWFRTEDAPSGRRAEGKVKWFDAAKGFGFVSLVEGGPDAFLPMAALRRAGYQDVREGAAISCEVGKGAKGPLVVAVLAIDEHAARPSSAPRAAETREGVVKRFDPARGFGFIAPAGGGRDIFVHVTAVRRSGLATLEIGQRVRVEVVAGPHGPEVDRVILL